MPSLNPKLQMLYLGLVSKAPKFIFQGLESAFKNFFSFAGVPGPIPRSEIEFPKPPTGPKPENCKCFT